MAIILPLLGHHDRKTFDCNNLELNRWFASIAQQHRAKGISTTYVAVETPESSSVFGFYSVSIAELRGEERSREWQAKLPQKVPVYRVGRLAVAKAYQNQGLGRLLLADVIFRLRRVAAEVGGVGVLVDAKPDAVGFYRKYGFEPMADHPLQLFLSF